MPAESVFDRLVSGLSSAERQDLLTKIRFSEKVSDAPLLDSIDDGKIDFDQVLAQLSFLERVVLFLKRILGGRDTGELVEEMAVKRIGRSLNSRASTVFSYRTMDLRGGMLDALGELSEAARFFRAPLKSAHGQHRKEFIAFLAGMELPLVQEELLKATDPARSAETVTEDSIGELKRIIEASMQNVFDGIAESDRAAMYAHSQCLFALFELSIFQFERFTTRFTSEGERRCQAQMVLPNLKDLAAILRRLAVPPRIGVLEALFLFDLRDRLEEPGFSLEIAAASALERAEENLNRIRLFNAHVPLTDIIRYVLGDPRWTPSTKAGGEDWFVLFKQFWLDRLNDQYEAYVWRQKEQGAVRRATEMLKLARLPMLEHYRNGVEVDEPRYAYVQSLGFLSGWARLVFDKDISRVVKTFLLDGRFYKEENKKMLTDAYNKINRIPADTSAFDRLFDPGGRFGHPLEEARESARTSAERERRMKSIAQQADVEARSIIESVLDGFVNMERVTSGILFGHGDDQFDTVSNLNSIGGRENGRLLVLMRMGHDKLAAAAEALAALFEIEKEIAE